MMAAYAWKSNAHMLADLRRILDFPTGPWCDLTYGQGKWWPRAVNPAPEGMVRCIGPMTADPAPHDVACDFRDTPFDDDAFGCVWYDPPYVLKGTDAQFAAMNAAYGTDSATMRARSTDRWWRPIVPPRVEPYSTDDATYPAEIAYTPLPKGWSLAISWGYEGEYEISLKGAPCTMTARPGYGGSRWETYWHTDDDEGDGELKYHSAMHLSLRAAVEYEYKRQTGKTLAPPTRKQALEQLIIDGLTEAVRITRPGGWVCAKAGRGIDGSRPFATDDLMVRTGWALGLTEVTSTWLLTEPRSQKHNGPQRSPRANTSRLTIFEVPT